MSEVVKNKKRFGVMRLTDALGYRLPLAGFVSILHRISGVLMFGLLPFVLYLFEQSLQSEISFAMLHYFASSMIVKLVLLVLVWAYLHHFTAGIRHLFMDFHFGLDKESGRRSAVTVLVFSLGLTFVVGLKLFGVF
ncbi:succinate dehydrogenase, cytochrome b556 subunit [Undibacterium fentianense]|uniref:Succinate dehydrogenase cytochrome b556 subunit n=1 Tax=Undibacterium fentianense TaxID=2828728 RepID=A0A941E4I2_9BURK|nr:succinate dehydrogenase, cytochrome b556 subunit [Undibacterium fentianense]MBR7798638.1 succinate dehydrogenase, cytochrome b556 subunit [Undibacterium fentianense]